MNAETTKPHAWLETTYCVVWIPKAWRTKPDRKRMESRFHTNDRSEAIRELARCDMAGHFAQLKQFKPRSR